MISSRRELTKLIEYARPVAAACAAARGEVLEPDTIPACEQARDIDLGAAKHGPAGALPTKTGALKAPSPAKIQQQQETAQARPSSVPAPQGSAPPPGDAKSAPAYPAIEMSPSDVAALTDPSMASFRDSFWKTFAEAVTHRAALRAACDEIPVAAKELSEALADNSDSMLNRVDEVFEAIRDLIRGLLNAHETRGQVAVAAPTAADKPSMIDLLRSAPVRDGADNDGGVIAGALSERWD